MHIDAILSGVITITDATNFGALISAFVNSPTVLLGMVGTANVYVNVPTIGSITLTDVAINDTVPVAGLNGISDVTVTSFSLASSTATAINAAVTVQFPTAGIVTFTPGPVQFQIGTSSGFSICNIHHIFFSRQSTRM